MKNQCDEYSLQTNEGKPSENLLLNEHIMAQNYFEIEMFNLEFKILN